MIDRASYLVQGIPSDEIRDVVCTNVTDEFFSTDSIISDDTSSIFSDQPSNVEIMRWEQHLLTRFR